MTDSARDRLAQHIDTIEKSYEFFLAYAAQGIRGGEGSKISDQLRKSLDEMVEVVTGLSELIRELQEDDPGTPEELDVYREVVRQDAEKAGAALRLVRAQESVSSQLIDNLNASVHLRALLTDLFLLDEILKLNVASPSEEEAQVP